MEDEEFLPSLEVEELLERYTARERDFSGVKVDNSKLRDTELPEINLSGAILLERVTSLQII